MKHGIVETTSYGDENRTFWSLRVEGQIVEMGETAADLAGMRSYDAAVEWAAHHGIEVIQWKHWNAGENSRGGQTNK